MPGAVAKSGALGYVYRFVCDFARNIRTGISHSQNPPLSISLVISKAHFGSGDHGSNVVPTNQSILVSGESGAGKTVTTKIVLNYFAMLSKKVSSYWVGTSTNAYADNL